MIQMIKDAFRIKKQTSNEFDTNDSTVQQHFQLCLHTIINKLLTDKPMVQIQHLLSSPSA